MEWSKVREQVLFSYGTGFDGEKDDDPCFYCPHCEEPIYEEDFPQIEVRDGFAICPICEEEYS